MTHPSDPIDNTSNSSQDPPFIPESTPMEVHHHAHGHAKKKVSDYFWEFLMLFLAVFCGFLAEYKLEHVIEHQREQTLMTTLMEELQTDDATLKKYMGWRDGVQLDFDSLLTSLSQPDPNQFGLSIYRQYNRSAMRFGLPDLNEGTIQQLKNAGGLRLVRNKEVVHAINEHYLKVGRMRSVFDTERLVRVGLVDAGSAVMDARLSMHLDQAPGAYRLMTQDKVVVNRFMNHILAAKGANQHLINALDDTRVSAERLRTLIDRAY